MGVNLRMRRHKSQKCFCAIDATAFSSVMVVLLIAVYVFYSAAAPGFHEYIYLPRVKHTTAQWGAASPDAMTLTIKESGRYFFGREQVTPEQIALKIQDHLDCGAPRKIYLKVDYRTRYKVLAQVLNAIQYAGVERVAFLTQPPTL